jgi:hypothetical protein
VLLRSLVVIDEAMSTLLDLATIVKHETIYETISVLSIEAAF